MEICTNNPQNTSLNPIFILGFKHISYLDISKFTKQIYVNINIFNQKTSYKVYFINFEI